MNKWTKSILIGLGVTLLFIIIAYVLKSRSTPGTYRGHYELRILPTENALTGNVKVIDKVADILKTRITNAGSAVEMKTLPDQAIDLRISKIRDTGQMAHILTGNSRMEFREMYILPDLMKTLSKADTLLGYKTKTEVKKVIVKPVSTDSSLVKFSETDPPAPEIVEKSLFQYLPPAQGYSDTSGNTRFPAYIGYVLKKDTAFVSAALQRKELMSSFPIDLKFLYGVPEKKNKDTEFMPIYAVRLDPGKPALLGNNDIMKAKADYNMYGNAEIIFEFNPVAARKWARMTEANIGKPIAIIIDNAVISAPNVNGSIPNGVAIISGGYTILEARELAIQLGTSSLPGSTTILKQEIARESRPLIPGNPLKFLLVFVVAGGISYLILSLLLNN